MKNFLMVCATNKDLKVASKDLATEVNKCLGKGYVLAGNLVCQADFSDDLEWHILIQPMILKEKEHEIIEH